MCTKTHDDYLWCDKRRVIPLDILKNERTVYSERYIQTQTKLKEIIRRKIGGKNLHDIQVHQDNWRQQTSLATTGIKLRTCKSVSNACAHTHTSRVYVEKYKTSFKSNYQIRKNCVIYVLSRVILHKCKSMYLDNSGDGVSTDIQSVFCALRHHLFDPL